MCYIRYVEIENPESYQKKLAKAQGQSIQNLVSGQHDRDLEIIKEKQVLCSRQRAVSDLNELYGIGDGDLETVLRLMQKIYK